MKRTKRTHGWRLLLLFPRGWVAIVWRRSHTQRRRVAA